MQNTPIRVSSTPFRTHAKFPVDEHYIGLLSLNIQYVAHARKVVVYSVSAVNFTYRMIYHIRKSLVIVFKCRRNQNLYIRLCNDAFPHNSPFISQKSIILIIVSDARYGDDIARTEAQFTVVVG